MEGWGVYMKQEWQLVKPSDRYKWAYHTVLTLHKFAFFHNRKEGNGLRSQRNLGLTLILIPF